MRCICFIFIADCLYYNEPEWHGLGHAQFQNNPPRRFECPSPYADIGKTCFLKQFIENHFAHAHPTVCVDFVSKTYQID